MRKLLAQSTVVVDKKKTAPPQDPAQVVISAEDLAELDRKSRLFARRPAKLKAWLTRRRLFHLLLQDRFSTVPPPGRAGPAIMARSSARFLDMSDALAIALGEEEEEEHESAGSQKASGRSVAHSPKTKGRNKPR